MNNREIMFLLFCPTPISHDRKEKITSRENLFLSSNIDNCHKIKDLICSHLYKRQKSHSIFSAAGANFVDIGKFHTPTHKLVPGRKIPVGHRTMSDNNIKMTYRKVRQKIALLSDIASSYI